MLKRAYRELRPLISLNRFHYLEKRVVELNDVSELRKVFGWGEEGILDRPDISEFSSIEDVNNRRIRDAEVLATVMINVKPPVAVEIGTADGMGTVLMAVNSPLSTVYTVNIPPKEIGTRRAGKLTSGTIDEDQIGYYYKQRKMTNVRQIMANTATWTPQIEAVGVALIDGCHDTWFVRNDTKKLLRVIENGGFILWHDFAPDLKSKYAWIDKVCRGVEGLIRSGYLVGRIYHVRDSWVGVYKHTIG